MTITPNHVAILVNSVTKVSKHLSKYGFSIGPEQIFESEGTKEIYIEGSKANSLLLIEPIKEGPNLRALKKRGTGVHHIAIDVLDLESYLESLTGTGWLLHPLSIKTIKQSNTAFLARPGFPALIEVCQKSQLSAKPLFIDQINLHIEPQFTDLITHVGLKNILIPKSESQILIGEISLKLKDFRD